MVVGVAAARPRATVKKGKGKGHQFRLCRTCQGLGISRPYLATSMRIYGQLAHAPGKLLHLVQGGDLWSLSSGPCNNMFGARLRIQVVLPWDPKAIIPLYGHAGSVEFVRRMHDA